MAEVEAAPATPLEDPAGLPGDHERGAEITLEAGASGFGGAEVQGAALGIKQQTQFGDFRKRFFRNKLAVVGLAMVSLVVLVAIFAPLLAPQDPYQQCVGRNKFGQLCTGVNDTQASPSSAHWFGTDENGRDQLSRVIYGSRIAILVGFSSIFIATLIGVTLGAISGYFGRFWDSLIMRTADVFFAFPVLIGAFVIILLLGRGVWPVILSIAIFSWATVARLLRSSILSIRETEYVEAARSLGASRARVVIRHILPNSLAPVLVYSAVSVAGAIVAEAALAFLGAGPRADVPDWGNMISAGRAFFGYKDFLWLYPALAVVFTVLGFVFVGDGLRDALDPKLR